MTLKTGDIKEISPAELKLFQEQQSESKYVLVDVRQPEEYSKGHIPGALLLPLPELEDKLTNFPPQKSYIFYCRSGRRSKVAATLAKDMGIFEGNIYNLTGGILAYQGKTLSNWPNLKSFSPTQDFKSIVLKSIELEKGAYLFYQKVGNFSHLIGKELANFQELEKKHAYVIYSWAKKKGVELEDFEVVFSSLKGDLLEGGESLESFLQKIKNNIDRTFLLELALEIETMAYDLYRGLLFKNFEEDSKTLFLMLAEQEKVHMRIIAQQFLNKHY